MFRGGGGYKIHFQIVIFNLIAYIKQLRDTFEAKYVPFKVLFFLARKFVVLRTLQDNYWVIFSQASVACV